LACIVKLRVIVNVSDAGITQARTIKCLSARASLVGLTVKLNETFELDRFEIIIELTMPSVEAGTE
jgi:hypothetical protein